MKYHCIVYVTLGRKFEQIVDKTISNPDGCNAQQDAVESQAAIENAANDQNVMNQTDKAVAESTMLDSEERQLPEIRPQDKHIVDRVARRV